MVLGAVLWFGSWCCIDIVDICVSFVWFRGLWWLLPVVWCLRVCWVGCVL